MDSSSMEMMKEMFFPVLMCYAAVFIGVVYLCFKLGKRKAHGPKAVFLRVAVGASVLLVILFYIFVSQISKLTGF